MKNKKKLDNVIPDTKWSFNSEVAQCFEDMLNRSIPQYDIMRKSILDLASYKIDKLIGSYSKEDLERCSAPFSVLDIGCSDGLQIKDFINKYGDIGKYTGIDVSEDMLVKARNEFKEQINLGKVSIENLDIRYNFPKEYYDVITSTLSIQFTPIEYRQEILSNVYKSLNGSGIFLMVEKVLGETSELNNLFVNNYYALKKQNGYDEESITRKKLSLEGVLVPCTNNWNLDLLKQAGFSKVDVFWRWMNFVGYIAIK